MNPSDKNTESEPIIAELPLWKSFWVGLFGAAFYGFVIALLLDFSRGAAALNMSANVSEIVGWAVFVPVYLLLMLSLWKCAYNTNHTFLGHLARTYAVLTSFLFIAILVTVIID